MSYAKVTLIGNVGRDPETRAVGDHEVCNFTIATSRKVKGEQITTWWSVSSWSERLNEILMQYVRKGDKLFLVGEPSARAYVTKGGEAACALEINISYGEMQMLSGKRDDDGDEDSRPARSRPTGRAKPQAKPAAKPRSKDPLDDDIPF